MHFQAVNWRYIADGTLKKALGELTAQAAMDLYTTSFKDALGFNGFPLAQLRAPACVLSSARFKDVVLGFIGRMRAASGHDVTDTAWEPRQKFFSVVAEPDKAGILNLIEFAAEIYYRTDEIQVGDMQLLVKLLNFLERYAGVEAQATADVRLQIDARLRAKASGRRWATYHQILRGHERAWFVNKLRPLFLARGYSTADAEDVLEVEWTEFYVQREKACRRCMEGAGMLGYPAWPVGLTSNEAVFGHVVADAIEAGEAVDWTVIDEMQPPTFSNELTKEDYVIMAAGELMDKVAERIGRVTSIPRVAELTMAERDDARKLRARILGGEQPRWCEFKREQGCQYMNGLNHVQFLALAAKLPPNGEAADGAVLGDVSEPEYFAE